MDIETQEAINKIDPNREYKLREIWKLKLIPKIKTYATLYNQVTKTVKSDDLVCNRQRIIRKKRVFRDDENRLIARVEKNPWNRIGKYKVKGQDIINYLKKYCG
jgi:hypothetical protein